MIKVKIYSNSLREQADKKELNRIQQHNLNYLLQGNYVSYDAYQNPSIAHNFVDDMNNQQV